MCARKLAAYHAKRDFTATPEPSSNTADLEHNWHEQPIFVVQEHAASHLHYDFRIQIGSVLVSWAVPKGPPTKPGERRLAIQTEDHPLSYAHFSGVIPAGNYGAGTVAIWDKGTYTSVREKDGRLLFPAESLQQGRLELNLQGSKLKGTYALIKIRVNNKKAWLFIKTRSKNKREPLV